jgi:hypothetical protein
MTIKTFQGKVKRVFAKALPEPDKFQNLFRLSLQLDDDSWVGFGGGKRETFTIKEGKGYYDVKVGDSIFLKYEDDGKYKNAKKSDLTVIEKSPEQESHPQPNRTANQSVQQQGQKSGGKKDTTGVEAGNVRTCAFNFFKGKLPDQKTIEGTMVFFAALAKKVKENFTNKHQELTEYEIGQTVGQSLAVAAMYVKDLQEVEDFVNNYLDNVVPFSIKAVKGEIKKDDTPKKENEVSSLPDEPRGDWDDDIPF